jgi:prepilin-type N-terminal cleavage/methylation domain-containing protein
VSGEEAVTRRGFTIVELVMAVSVVLILTGIALPSVRLARQRAAASAVQGHLQQLNLRIARLCRASLDCTDPDSPIYTTASTPGTAPTWLADSLGATLAFDQAVANRYVLGWSPVVAASGTTALPDSIEVISPPNVCRRIRRSYGGRIAYGALAVVDVTPGATTLGDRLAAGLGDAVSFEPTGQYPNRWVVYTGPTALRDGGITLTPDASTSPCPSTP